MTTIRLTTAQALVRYLVAQRFSDSGKDWPLFAGMWAIFGHGNVAGLGEALYAYQDKLPTYRAHNEQAMAHAAIAYAKAKFRRQVMACTTSIGPGATNLVTAAALAHVNRLPVLLLPGDVFANRKPDPVLQQIEDFSDATLTANDTLRPVSRFFDRITRPEQIMASLPRAVHVLTDPADCGPATLALCQDVQAEAYDFPLSFFDTQVHHLRRPQPDTAALEQAAHILKGSKRPLIIAGGGVLYSDAWRQLADFAHTHAIPVAETQAGKGSLASDHPAAMGAIGVTGTQAANAMASSADVVLAIGTRLQDFTTGSRALFENDKVCIIQLNVTPFDATKHNAIPFIADARAGLLALRERLGKWEASGDWQDKAHREKAAWGEMAFDAIKPSNAPRPSDAQVVGIVNNFAKRDDTVVCAAGGLPGELHKLWRVEKAGGYHVEYGYSCMGYEIAGGLGVKMAKTSEGDTGDVLVMIGDGSYLMLNSEIATSVMLGQKLIIVVLDNRGYGCITRLQKATGGAPFNNLFDNCLQANQVPIDFAAHAASMGAHATHVNDLNGLSAALEEARGAAQTSVIVIDTDPWESTQAGGAWWDVAVPEVSSRHEVNEARESYEKARQKQGR